jgi:hypothetical protein
MEFIDLSGLNQLIKPELLVLAPVLNLLGAGLKHVCGVNKHKHIPVILMLVSVGLSCLWVFGTTQESISATLFTGIVQGVLIAGTAVWGHQVCKQYGKNDGKEKNYKEKL